MKRARGMAVTAMTATVVVLVATFGSAAQAANSSEQVIFSGTGFGTFANQPSPFGFWIWCEADSLNPYQGNCAGSIYIYGLGLVKGVSGDDAITEPSEHKYVITVADHPWAHEHGERDLHIAIRWRHRDQRGGAGNRARVGLRIAMDDRARRAGWALSLSHRSGASPCGNDHEEAWR
jgi:hypothetical protein